MHRPIVWSETARSARVYVNGNREALVGPRLSPETFEHANRTVDIKTPEEFVGKVSSYNSNTFKGRIFLPEFGRPVPFELAEIIRGRSTVTDVTTSLRTNAISRSNSNADVWFKAFRRESSQGRLKSLYVIELSNVLGAE